MNSRILGSHIIHCIYASQCIIKNLAGWSQVKYYKCNENYYPSDNETETSWSIVADDRVNTSPSKTEISSNYDGWLRPKI
jgi:hypothetical protein